jgi:hypothetical protein
MARLSPPALVLVTWEDSAQPEPRWRFTADASHENAVMCHSAGYLIHKGDAVLLIAPNIGDFGTPNEQVSGIIRIPSRSVVRMQKLVGKPWNRKRRARKPSRNSGFRGAAGQD